MISFSGDLIDAGGSVTLLEPLSLPLCNLYMIVYRRMCFFGSVFCCSATKKWDILEAIRIELNRQPFIRQREESLRQDIDIICTRRARLDQDHHREILTF